MNEFIDYVMDFYGANGIYDMGATREEVEVATQIRINSANEDSPFDGDSFDREFVRDIMISMRKGVAA